MKFKIWNMDYMSVKGGRKRLITSDIPLRNHWVVFNTTTGQYHFETTFKDAVTRMDIMADSGSLQAVS